MGKVKYKTPPESMNRMIIQPSVEDRVSIGMNEVKGEIYYLTPDLIIPYKNQARREFDEISLEELSLSIKAHGVIQPLQVINSTNEVGKFEVVSGERRLNAARKAGIEKIPCMILDREKDANEIALIENIQRVDLHPIELADAIAMTLTDNKYGNQLDLAVKIGVSKQQISHLVAIARLPRDVKEHLLVKKDMSVSELRKLAYLKDENLIRAKVFVAASSNKKYKSLLRLTYNGEAFKFDHLKIDKLTSEEKHLMKLELEKILTMLS